MLAIGRCLMGKPDLVMFDEPSLGLAPAIVQDVLKTIRDLNRDGPDLRAGGAERGGVAQACEPRLCAGERPGHAVGHRRGIAGRRPRAAGLSRNVIQRLRSASSARTRTASGASRKVAAQLLKHLGGGLPAGGQMLDQRGSWRDRRRGPMPWHRRRSGRRRRRSCESPSVKVSHDPEGCEIHFGKDHAQTRG